jgi:hypothetical protein
MTQRLVVLMLFIATLAGGAQAFLPPDAKARAPQLRAYYQQVRDNYEIKQAELQVERARAREQAEVDIRTPPWMRGEQAVQTRAEAVAAVAADKTHKIIRRILISIIFLSLIVGGAGWVWYKTREIDG